MREPDGKWRHFLAWGAAGFIVCALVVSGYALFIRDGGLDAMLDSRSDTSRAGLFMIVVILLLGFSQRNVPVTARNVRNLLILSGLTIAVVVMITWGVGAFPGAMALGVSATIALVLGLSLSVLAIFGLLIVSLAYARVLPAEIGTAIVERGRLSVYTWVWLAAIGLMEVLLSLAGPGGAVSPTAALIGLVPLLATMAAIIFAMWPLLDELSQTMSRETGNAAFYLIVVIGGGWAILAHLGFVSAPAPLDWVTMFTLIMFAASVLAASKRGLLMSR
jgi:hypothetical protein